MLPRDGASQHLHLHIACQADNIHAVLLPECRHKIRQLQRGGVALGARIPQRRPPQDGELLTTTCRSMSMSNNLLQVLCGLVFCTRPRLIESIDL